MSERSLKSPLSADLKTKVEKGASLPEFARAINDGGEAAYSTRSQRELGWFGSSSKIALGKYRLALPEESALEQDSEVSARGDFTGRDSSRHAVRRISSVIAETVKNEFGCPSDRLENFYSGLHVPVKHEFVPHVDTRHLIVPSERCGYYCSDRSRLRGSMYTLQDFKVKQLPSDCDKASKLVRNERRLAAVKESHKRFDDLIGRKEARASDVDRARIAHKQTMVKDYCQRVGSKFCHVSS